MSDFIKLNSNRWVYVYANLSLKDKKELKRYFSTVYPRNYVKKLVAALEAQTNGFQSK